MFLLYRDASSGFKVIFISNFWNLGFRILGMKYEFCNLMTELLDCLFL